MSSARAVRCQVKSYNERNPYPQLPAVRPGTLRELPTQVERKAGMTSNQHGPYVRGDTRATMAGTEGRPDSVKLESLVIAHQPWRGEYVPGPCTHRPSSHGSRGYLKPARRRCLG